MIHSPDMVLIHSGSNIGVLGKQRLGDKGIDYRAGSDDVDGFIAFYDKNDDGLISKDEYKRGQRAWFRKKDKNRDGVLSLADLR